MRISDWSSDVCSSDLRVLRADARVVQARGHRMRFGDLPVVIAQHVGAVAVQHAHPAGCERRRMAAAGEPEARRLGADDAHAGVVEEGVERSEEHTSELQSLMRISYAVFCLKTKKHHKHQS